LALLGLLAAAGGIQVVEIKVDTTGLTDGQNIDANDVLVPLVELKTILENTLNGIQAFDRLSFGEAHEEILAAGAIGSSFSHVMMTPESGVSDDLTAITGAAPHKWVLLRTSTPGDTITIKHDVGNIVTATGVDIVLNSKDDWALAIFTDMIFGSTMTQKWIIVASTPLHLQQRGAASPVDMVKIKVPDRTLKDEGGGVRRLLYRPSLEAGSVIFVRPSPPDIREEGIARPTIANAALNDYLADPGGPLYGMNTSRTTGTAGGLISTTFTIVRLEWEPTFYCEVMPTAPLAGTRIWIGLCASAPANAVNVGTPFVGWRYSTFEAANRGWIPVLRDSSVQNAGTIMSPLQAAVRYALSFRFDGDAVIFRVNDEEEQVLSDNLPDVSANLGFCVRLWTLNARNKRLYFGGLEIVMQ
jgi:hypothetical protein